jgi:hypothetical protein
VTINLFAPKPPVDARSTQSRLPAAMFGMKPETVGAVGYFELLPEAAKSVNATGAGTRQFRIMLPGGAPVICSLVSQVNAEGAVVLSGAPVNGNPFGHCALVVQNGQITGIVDTGSGRYRIVPVGTDNTHAIVEIRTEAFPNENTPLRD